MKNNPNNIEVIDPVIINTDSNMSTETQTPVDLDNLSEDQLLAALKKKQAVKQKAEFEKRHAYEMDNDNFIVQSISKAKELRNTLREFKEYSIREANKLYTRMYELQDKEPKEQKQFSRISECGNFKVTVDMQEKFMFTDEAEVHLSAIQDILKEKFEARNKGFYKFFERIMMRNGKGEFDPKLLYKAKKEAKELGEQSIIDEIEKLDSCQRVVGSSLYCRFYEKNERNKWQDISLNFSSL